MTQKKKRRRRVKKMKITKRPEWQVDKALLNNRNRKTSI